GAHRAGDVAIGIPQPGLLHDPAAARYDLDLARDLVLERALDRTEGVHVLDLGARAERVAAGRAHRDVGVAAKAAFLHVAVADLEILQGRAQRAEVRDGLGGTLQLGLADDLEQRHAGAVEIDDAGIGVSVVDVLARVLLEMDAHQPHALLDPALREAHGAADADRR